MFIDPMFYEDTDYLTEEERKRKAAQADLPSLPESAKVPDAPAPSAIKEPDLPKLEPINAADVNGPTPAPLSDLPPWTSRDQLKEDIKSEPKLERPGGWKGALQRVGEVATNVFLPGQAEQIMHPKYSDQMRDYQRKVGQDIDMARSDDALAENQRKQAVAERQMSASQATEAAARALEALAEKQAAEAGKPKLLSPIAVNAPAIYDPNTKTWSKNPHYQEKKGTYQQKLDAMKEQVHIANPELSDDEAYQMAANKMLDYQQSAIDRNRAGVVSATAGAGNASARTDLTVDEVARRRRDDSVEQDAAKVLADNKGDYDTATSNVMNPQWYGHLGDDKYRASVADALRALKAKRDKKAGGLLARAKSGATASQSAPTAPGASAKPTGQVASKADVQAFAKAHGMTYDQAKNAAQKEGWTVQE